MTDISELKNIFTDITMTVDNIKVSYEKANYAQVRFDWTVTYPHDSNLHYYESLENAIKDIKEYKVVKEHNHCFLSTCDTPAAWVLNHDFDKEQVMYSCHAHLEHAILIFEHTAGSTNFSTTLLK
jgi:hypothetical protein